MVPQIQIDPIMNRFILSLLFGMATKVLQVIIPRFEPNFFAQTIEKYKLSVGSTWNNSTLS